MFKDTLALLIETDIEYRSFKSKMEDAKARLDVLKVACMSEFEELGIDQIKTQDRTVYVGHQIWAGNAEDVDTRRITEELHALGLDEFISYNHQSFSSYVRETVRQHPDMLDSKGDIVASPEEILAVLPGSLAQLCRVTDKMDIKIRKG
jgi:hypothetical protein